MATLGADNSVHNVAQFYAWADALETWAKWIALFAERFEQVLELAHLVLARELLVDVVADVDGQ